MSGGDLRTGELRLDDKERTGFAVRLSVFYAALFVIYGMHVPYLPVWLHWRELTAQEISIVTAAPFFIRLLVTPTAAMVADRLANHRAMVIGLAWIGLVLSIVLSQMSGFWLLLLTAVPFAVAISTIMPLTEAIAVAGVITAGLDYGRMRLWGSLSFIVIGLLGGHFVDDYGGGVAIWLIIVGAVATVAAAHLLPARPVMSTPARRKPGHGMGSEALKLVTNPVFLWFLLASGAVQGAHAMFYTFGVLHWQAQGISTTSIGILWAVGVLAEVALFAGSGAVVGRFGATALLVSGSAAAIFRWSAMALNPPFLALLPLQLLHALTYGATHLGAIHFISRAVPPAAAGTAQALYATVAAGVMMGGATLASGTLYHWYEARAYLAMAVLCAVGLLAGFLVKRRWDGAMLWAPDAVPAHEA